MDALRTLYRLLLIPPAAALAYDLIYEWFVKNRLRINTLKYWWQDLAPASFDAVAGLFTTPELSRLWKGFTELHAPIALLLPPLVFFIAYKLLFKAKGGRGGMYRSAD